MKSLRFALLATLLVTGLSGAARAASEGADGAVIHRLSPEQIAAIAEAQAKRGNGGVSADVAEDPLVLLDDEPVRARPLVHGQIGFGIGTNGYSAVFGTLVAPLGDNGMVALSFAQQNGGFTRRYRRR